MASLFIKDSETAALAAELAAMLGTTKTELVRDCLRRRKAELAKSAERKADFVTWMKQYRNENPLPPPHRIEGRQSVFR